MTSKYGEFMEPGYLKPGALYQKVVHKKGEHTADNSRASFKSGQPERTGKLNDATFTRFESTNVGLGDGVLEDRKLKKKEVRPVGGAFKPASPMQQSSAPQAGDYYGTLNKIEHFQGTISAKRKKGDIKQEPRNFYTSAPKSGGLGTNNFTLSQIKGSKGVAGEYEYMADPIHEATKQPEGKAAGAPFKPPQLNSRAGVFNKLEYKSPGPEKKLTKQEAEKHARKGPAFAPSFAGHTMPKPHEYLANPVPQAKVHKKDEATQKTAWRPGVSEHSGCSPSILRMNV